MGKSNAKPTISCPSSERHKGHTFSTEVAETKDGKRVSDFKPVKAWCPGVGHVHDWERHPDAQPVLRDLDTKKEVALGKQGVPWNGPFECSCGMSRWLTDGRVKSATPKGTRFPDVEPMQRIMDIKWRLEAGATLDDDDKEEIRLISEALAKAFQPLVEAFIQLAEMVIAALNAFVEALPPEMKAQLEELIKAYGEKPDRVDTVDLVTDAGDTMATVVVGHDPVSALTAAGMGEEYINNLSNLAHNGLNKLRKEGRLSETERDAANFEATGVEANFWDDRTTPLAYSEADSERDLAARREARYAYNEIFGVPFPTRSWTSPGAIRAVQEDIDRHNS